ncbi:DUF2218 domain-containing protein [Acidocella facilis]|uniref:DUF2218 domain-containing protein n=1 Tax=Acidocella facilis TaxID=525 RepID=UPI00047AAC6D|nr:DUF2218 domain-containing protein [Acidocella facilis]
MNATAIIPTAQARDYLGQFVSHFAPRLPALREADNSAGEVSFSAGLCTLDADARKLSIIVNAGDAQALEALKRTIDQHLLLLAAQEELSIEWNEHPAPEG